MNNQSNVHDYGHLTVDIMKKMKAFTKIKSKVKFPKNDT